MNPQDWQTLDTLFQEALDLAPPDRGAFLDRVATDHPELVNRLRTLLAADEEGTHALDRPAWEHASGTLEELDRVGTRVGPYRILSLLGRGGMASVYLAERADGQWKNRVALKILHRGLDTESIVRRFLEERQILSSLDHPNIARFLGGGTSDEGLPWLVMEYVEDGVTLLEHCDEERLGIRDRVALFRQVAEAVQAAHRRLIAHRDVKPSNVMVDGTGRVKLLDFGIAKILDPSADPGVTQVGQRVLTPAYASPEQVTGDAITTASDVYQLGVLLCELLSGHRPYGEVEGGTAAQERAILQAAPVPMSRLITDGDARLRGGVTRSTASGELQGDLDTIVEKTLRKDPDERYASAGALADDLQRYLDGLPVSARPPSLAYRAGKFVQRHRSAVTAAAGFVLMLAGATVFSTVQAVRANQERDRARLEQMRAESVTAFVTDVLTLVDPDVTGENARANQAILDAGVEQARIRLADQPGTLADVLGTIGEVYLQLGRAEPAVDVAREALALREHAPGNVRRKIRDLLTLGYAEIFYNENYDTGLASYREAVAVSRAELDAADPLLAEALTGLADVVREPGSIYQDQDRAMAMIDEALGILRSHPRDSVGEALAEALYVAGTIHDRFTPQAVEELRESVEIRRELFGRYNTGLAITLNDLAMHLELTNPAATDSLLAEAIEIQSHLYGMSHTRTLTLMTNRAAILRDRGAYAEAEPIYRDLLRIRAEHYPDHTLGRAYILHGLGWILAEQGKAREAEVHLREMLAILEAAGDDMESDRYQLGRGTLGRALALQGRHDEAERLLLPALRWYREHLPEAGTTDILETRVAELYEDWGRPPPEEIAPVGINATASGA